MQARLVLYAINPDHHIKRFFNISVSLNLFNEYSLTINRGRIGKGGSIKSWYYNDLQSLCAEIKKILKRRFSAESRLGTNYQVISTSFDEEFNQKIWSNFDKSL